MQGHALIIAGSPYKTGAAFLAAKSCIQSGAGLVTVYCDNQSSRQLNQFCPEAMSLQNESELKEALDNNLFDSILIGPGLGQSQEAAVLLDLLLQYSIPTVLDADALNIIGIKKWHRKIHNQCILTPHVREFSRITRLVQSDYERLKLLSHFVETHGCICLLKGAHTMMAHPNKTVYFNTTGNPYMATAGSGDCLAGIITALLAQGYGCWESSKIATFLHGLAGDEAIKKQKPIKCSNIIDNIHIPWED
ncbi:UNVERIFIED_CONTAM: hypothetical protein GTU68_049743 [Idotea baltica]|nr:hypothetical protein [Idotea baltica]